MLEDNLSGKIYDMVKIKLGRGTYTHSEIVKEVSFISSAVFSCEDKPTINDIVARYEENHPNVEVIAPDILAANTNDGKWFERKREIKQADLQDGLSLIHI